jgi:hypothetical protein
MLDFRAAVTGLHAGIPGETTTAMVKGFDEAICRRRRFRTQGGRVVACRNLWRRGQDKPRPLLPSEPTRKLAARNLLPRARSGLTRRNNEVGEKLGRQAHTERNSSLRWPSRWSENESRQAMTATEV